MLGLTEQVPARFVYSSTGPTRESDILGTQLQFRHQKTQHTAIGDQKSAVLVQALHAIGKESVGMPQMERLGRLFSAREYARIVRRTTTASTWIHDVIKEVARLAAAREQAK